MTDAFTCHYINDETALKAFTSLLKTLDDSSYIAFDTEFTRNRTFYPTLDLLQFAIGKDVYLVDPHAENFHPKNFFKVFSEVKSTVLVFAATEDLEILAHEGQGNNRVFPENIIDLQALYAFLNKGYNIGLKNILSIELDIHLLKEETHSDWSVRPLSESQMRYAREDVIYLLPLYEKLKTLFLKNDARWSFYRGYMDSLILNFSKETDTESLYMHVKGAAALNNEELKVLKYLCKWRYEFAKARNVAPNWIITNVALCALCREKHLTFHTLIGCGVKYPAAKTYGEQVIKWHEKARSMPSGELCTIDYFFNMKENQKASQKLKSFLINRARRLDIAKELLCSKALMYDYFYCRHFKITPQLSKGWYKEAIGPVDI